MKIKGLLCKEDEAVVNGANKGPWGSGECWRWASEEGLEEGKG